MKEKHQRLIASDTKSKAHMHMTVPQSNFKKDWKKFDKNNDVIVNTGYGYATIPVKEGDLGKKLKKPKDDEFVISIQ